MVGITPLVRWRQVSIVSAILNARASRRYATRCQGCSSSTKVEEGCALRLAIVDMRKGAGGRGALVRHNSHPLAVFTALLPTVGTLKAALTLLRFFFFPPSLRQLDWKSFKDLEASSHTFRLAPLMRHPDLLCYSDVEPSEMLKYYVFPSLAILPREHKAARVKSAQCWVLFAGSGWRGSVTQWLCSKVFSSQNDCAFCSPEPFRVLCTFF